MEKIRPLPGDDPEKIRLANAILAEKERELALDATSKGLSQMAGNPGEEAKIRKEMEALGVKFYPNVPKAQDQKPSPENRVNN